MTCQEKPIPASVRLDKNLLNKVNVNVSVSRIRILVASIAVTACLSLGVQRINAQGSPDFETVALNGASVPGADAGVVFAGFSPPSLNASGQTAFIAGLAGDVVEPTNNSGIYSGDSGILTQVARTGDQVPGADIGVVFNSFNLPTLTDSGQTGFSNLVATASEPILLGDVNLDGEVNFLDISPFIVVLSTGVFQAEADVDQSGNVDFLDISPFIAVLSGL